MNLEKNSQEMKTVVETFIIEETAELIYNDEKLDQWNNHVSELGLTGQGKIVKPTKSPIPFLHMKQSLINVFECLCPRKVDITVYEATPIPVEILEMAALSKREKYFSKIEIWYDDKAPDPICVGVKGHFYQPTWHSNRKVSLDNQEFESEQAAKDAGAENVYFNTVGLYLLGKWADVKHSFEELKEMATKRFIAQKGNELRKKIKESERELLDLETTAFESFN